MEFLDDEDLNGNNGGMPNATLGSRAVLKELNSNDSIMQLSPLAAKSIAGNKTNTTPSSRPQPTAFSPNATFVQPTTSAGTVAAFEANSTFNEFRINPELEAGIFEDANIVLGHNNSGVNKSCNKFIGLTEFDESSMPELPESLNPDIEEQLKLTFEEGLIPTLTANVNTCSNSINKSDAIKPLGINHLLVNNIDMDTASSDNETFAECESFANIANDLAAYEHQMSSELSEAETFRSALNSNTTVNINEEDILNATMENVAELTEDVQLLLNSNAATQAQIAVTLQKVANDLQFADDEDEPMDVDMNLTQEMLQYAKNITTEADDQIRNAAVKTPTLQHVDNVSESLQQADSSVKQHVAETFENTQQLETIKDAVQQHVDNLSASLQPVVNNESASLEHIDNMEQKDSAIIHIEPHVEKIVDQHVDKLAEQFQPITNKSEQSLNLDSLLNVSANNRLTFSISSEENVANEPQSENNRLTFSMSSDENVTNEPQSENNLSAPEMQQTTTHEISLNKSIELPTNCLKSAYSNECIIQANSADSSATDTLLPATTATDVVKELAAAMLPANIDHNIGNDSSFSTTAAVAVAKVDEVPLKMTSSLPNAGSNLNLTLDMSMSFSSAKGSAPTSPTFPFKQPKKDMRHFPRSPAAEVEREMCYLEKSEYAEYINTSSTAKSHIKSKDSQQSAIADIQIIPPSPSKKSSQINLNETIELSHDAAADDKSPLPINDLTTVLNGTFDGSPATSPLEVAADAKNRRTFSIASTSELEIASSPAAVNLNNSDIDKRRTFNLSDIAASPQQNTTNAAPTNDNDEPMDVDVSTSIPATSKSPPLPTVQQSQQEAASAALHMPSPKLRSPMLPITLQKRPPIHPTPTDADAFSLSPSSIEMLSAKEQTKCNSKDEKDIFVEQFAPSVRLEDIFKAPTLGSSFKGFGGASNVGSSEEQFSDADFQDNNKLILNPSDFDYLLTKGNNNVSVDRSSLLLKFDPLLGVPVPVNQPIQQQQQLLQVLGGSNYPCLSPTIEEDEHHNENNRSYITQTKGNNSSVTAASLADSASGTKLKERSVEVKQELQVEYIEAKPKKNASMSVDVIKDINIDNDCNKTFENSNSQSDEKQSNFKMDELEKKIRNEVLKTEDIEKKLKEAEQREEALIKRITDKDKATTRMNGVIEAYEKAIAELIAEKEQLIQNYEKQLADVKADRDSNYHHLTSLETTFSDLHVKYEKSKEMTSQLKSSEESLLAEKRQNLENLRLQEQRYEKMKNHAMQQLEIANKKLETLTKEHAIEATKLKALLKKEEISRASINEQLHQKSRENAELMKICDELINGQGS